MTLVDVAPIAEDFFQRLVYETNPLEAVGTLANRWEVRAQKTGRWLGLSEPEYRVTMALIYVGEVGNGGHVQFFCNRAGETTARVRAALRDLGLMEVEAVLGEACAFFPRGQVPADHGEVERLLDTWTSNRLAETGRLDRKVSELDAYPRLLAYLREHASDVLRPERGLSKTAG
jgi:hypothetical protein